MIWLKQKKIYLDYAAATPVLPEVKREMEKYWSKDFYNPNAIYQEGLEVKRVVEEAREKIARLIGAAAESVIFTSGGTEANVLAVQGVKEGKIEIEAAAHLSVFDAALGREGTETVLVSSVTTDNKLGRKIRAERKGNQSEYPLLHVDASQTAGYYPVGLERLACDLLTLDAAKLYGPKGIGALIVRSGVKIKVSPRGTPPVALIVGFAKALEIAARDREAEHARLDKLSAHFASKLAEAVPEALAKQEGVNVVNVSVPNVLPEMLVLALEREGVLVSAGSACLSNKPEPLETPVRFSLGRFTTEKELNQAVKAFCQALKNVLQ